MYSALSYSVFLIFCILSYISCNEQNGRNGIRFPRSSSSTYGPYRMKIINSMDCPDTIYDNSVKANYSFRVIRVNRTAEVVNAVVELPKDVGPLDVEILWKKKSDYGKYILVNSARGNACENILSYALITFFMENTDFKKCILTKGTYKRQGWNFDYFIHKFFGDTLLYEEFRYIVKWSWPKGAVLCIDVTAKILKI